MECFAEDRTKKPRKRQMSRAKRLLANRRERERVRKMNDAFEELRSTIPNYEETRVKTKLELLRIATNYIQSLQDSLQNSIRDGYNSPMNALMYPSEYEMESNEGSKSGPRISDYPYPPQFPAPPPPAFTELTSFQFAPHQTVPHVSQFSAPLSGPPESSTQEICSLLSASIADPHSGESFLYNLQTCHGPSQAYLSTLLQEYRPPRNLHSPYYLLPATPVVNSVTTGQRAFSYYALVPWNPLPSTLKSAPFPSFRTALKDGAS